MRFESGWRPLHVYDGMCHLPNEERSDSPHVHVVLEEFLREDCRVGFAVGNRPAPPCADIFLTSGTLREG